MLRQQYGHDIYNAMNDAIFIVDRASLRIMYANRVLSNVIGMEPGMLLDMTLLDLYADADRDVIAEYIAQMGDQMVHFGAQVLPYNSNPFYADTRVTPGHEEGQAHLVCVIASPGQPSLAQELQERETVYRSLLDALSDIIFRIREDGTYLEFKIPDNRGLKMLAPDQIVGKKIADIVPAEVNELAMPAIARALQSRHPETIKYSIQEPSGLHYYECCFVPSLENEVVAVVRDVTQQKQQETTLRIQRDLWMALSFETSLHHALELVVDASLEAAEMDCGGIYLVDPVAGALALVFQRGLSEEFVQVSKHYAADTQQAHLVLQGQPIYSHYGDPGIDTVWVSQRENLHAIAIVPVLHHNQAIACINVASHDVDVVSQSARNALENIAAQIGSAIVRIRAEEALHRKDRLLESVALAANRLMASSERRTVFNDALAILGQGIGFDQVFIYESHAHPDTGEPVASFRYGWSSERVAWEVDTTNLQNLPWKAFGIQDWYDKLIANEEISISRSDFRQILPPYIALPSSIESVLLMPILVNGEFWGGIGFSNHHMQHESSAEEISVLRIIAASVGAAIERQQAEDRLRHEHTVANHERKLANTLREVGMALTSTLELDAVLGRILEQALRVIPYDAANVFLIDGQVARMVHHHGYEAFGLSNEVISQIVLRPRQMPIIQNLISHGLPYVCSSVKSTDNWYDWPGFEWIKSWLGVPIVVRNKVVAIFSFDSTVEGFYNKSHVRLIEPFAEQAAIAFENAQLFEDIQRLERIKSEMIRMASHDLGSPLTRIKETIRRVDPLLPADMARSVDTDTQSALSTCMHDLQDAIEEMEQIVLNILSVERIEAQHRAARSINWCELLAESVRSIDSELEDKQHELNIECEADLPVVFGMPAQLQSAMSNLIGNAIKYTPPGGQIQVRLFQNSYGGVPTVSFEVQDNGIGIPPELQEQLFEPFYRAVQPGAETTSGLGLGLSIVKSTIKFHKGRVYFDSEPGKGSLFGFWIPI